MSIFKMKDQIQHPSHQSERGFSLIEVAIALMIIGLLIVPFAQQFNLDAQKYRVKVTVGNIDTAKNALGKFALKYGYYPLPATPSLASGNNNGAPVAAAPTVPCTPNILTACVTLSGRDADGVAGNDPVYLGTLPFAVLGLTEAQSIDGWGNKIGYAVTGNLTEESTFDSDWGVIRLSDNTDVPAEPVSENDNALHIMVYSHGEDGKGAFNLAGTQTVTCGSTTAARDNENCDNDSRFDDGSIWITRNDPSTGLPMPPERIPSIKSPNLNANFWNDYYMPIATLPGDEWVPVPNSPNMYIQESIRINKENEDDRIRVDIDGTTRATEVFTEELCETDMAAGFCMSPALIGTDTPPNAPPTPSDDRIGIRCASGVAMTGIRNGNQICDPVSIDNMGSLNFPPCPTGQFPRGISSTGSIVCDVP